MFLLLTWLLLGLLLGVVSYVLVPWTLAFLGGVELRDRVGRYFIKQTMTVLGDAALVARKQGGISLNAVSWDASFGGDRVTVAGQTGHIKDDLDLKSRLSGKPFGLALESHPVYISPLFSEYAEYASDAMHGNRIGVQPDGGVRLDFEVPELPTVPDLRGTYRILDGDARRYYSTLAESWAQKSQEKFGKRVSMGQTLLLMASFAVGVGMALLINNYGADSSGGGIEVPIMIASSLLAVAPDDDWRSWIQRHSIGLRVAVALTVVALGFVGLIAFAAAGWGALAAVLFVGGLVVGVSGPPVSILLLRDGIPAGGLIGTGLVICAQIAFGQAALVRRDDDAYEWTALREGDRGYYAELSDGREVPIDADRGELFAFGFGTLAITEMKTDKNMERWTTVDTPGDSDAAAETRAGVPVAPPKQERSGWLVTLANIQRAIRGSASSDLVRRGRDKALDETGGTQQLSQLWTMGFATALLFGGFILGYGAMLL